MPTKKTNEQFLSELQQVHENKITALEPYMNSVTKMRFQCTVCTHKWEAVPRDILSGKGCPKCGLKKTVKFHTKTDKQFLIDLKKIQGNKVTPLEPYNKSHVKIRFRCNTCNNVWKTTPSAILAGHGCPKCGIEKRTKTLRKTNEQFLLDLKQVQGNKITPLEPYVNNKTKVLFRCNTCGYKWKTTPNDMLYGYSCPKCGGNAKRTTEQFLIDLKKVWGDSISMLETYTTLHTKMQFHCNVCTHEWKAEPNSILRGEGCPWCAFSKGEKMVSAILETNKVNHQRQYKVDFMSHHHYFDFYLELNSKKYFIEYDGRQHVKIKGNYYTKSGHLRDLEKNDYADLIGAKMIRIPYTMDTLDTITAKLSSELGIKLIVPDKTYLPYYKRTNKIAKYYLTHSITETCNIFQIGHGTAANDFKQIYGYRKKEYLNQHPQLKQQRKDLKRRKPILCIETNTKYNSIKEAAKDFNIPPSYISSVLSGRYKTTLGLHFEYLNKKTE